ncbi:MAG: hypothetical protein KME64_37685 [Scytonematopsis contorta HA4267-MV1]|jgi:hypothetical protein|nr:hypothetical protein [Scytonematopsis contorta HA4267-MV1]
MISTQLQTEIDKYKNFPRWIYQFPPYVERHYFDNLLVFHYDRTNPGNMYCDRFYDDGAQPTLLVIRFDGQLVLVKYQNSVLIDRLPLQPD